MPLNTKIFTFPTFAKWYSGAVLLIAAPFLLFPTQFPTLTVLSLLLLLSSWVLELFHFKHLPAIAYLNTTLILLGLTICLAILVSADPEWTLPKATGLVLGITTLRYLTHYFHTTTHIHWLTITYIIVGLGMVSLGVVTVNWSGKIPLLSQWLNRLPQQLLSLPGSNNGTVHANQLAGTLLLVTPFTTSLIFAKNLPFQPFSRLFITIVTAILLTLIVFSQSRAGWLGMVIALVGLLWLSSFMTRSRWRIGRWLLPLLGIIILILLLLSLGWQQILSVWLDPPDETFIGSFGSLGFRQEVWLWAITAIQDFPFTGTGLGTFRRVVFRLYPIAVPIDYDIAHAHNIFLQTALDLGIPGLVIYLALIGRCGQIAWQIAKHHPPWRPLMLGCLATLIALHTYGLLDALALGSKPGLLFWLLLALPFIVHQHTALPTPQSQSTPVRMHSDE